MTTKQQFPYWIKERYAILRTKADGHPPPWSDDPVFQSTYFCNVHREDDKVTKYIRRFYNPYVDNHLFELNIVLSRFLNWPDTLERVGYLKSEHLPLLKDWLEALAENGKIWGNAYVITSHGMKMPKITYLCVHLLPDMLRALPTVRAACGWPVEDPMSPVESAVVGGATIGAGTCGKAARALQCVQGIGSFLSGQIVADLKNTPGHPLFNAVDKSTFVVPGPGSIRGLNWWHYDKAEGSVNERNFHSHFYDVRDQIDELDLQMPFIDNQDLQNCLCEFDKYMRVKTGSGRSKRGYRGV